MNMSEDSVTAVELLSNLAKAVEAVATDLRKNRLDRRAFVALLHDYSARAESDGRLINASRQDRQCVDRGLFLAYRHIELISWLAKNNYTIPSASVKWYSWKKLFSKYRLPLFSVASHTANLRCQLKSIKDTADLVYADLQANNVSPPLFYPSQGDELIRKISIPPTSIRYAQVPMGDTVYPPPQRACKSTFCS